MNVSYIPFSISKLLCVQFFTQTPARQYRVKCVMSMSIREMKRTHWIQEQTEQVKNI